MTIVSRMVHSLISHNSFFSVGPRAGSEMPVGNGLSYSVSHASTVLEGQAYCLTADRNSGAALGAYRQGGVLQDNCLGVVDDEGRSAVGSFDPEFAVGETDVFDVS